VYIHSSQEVDNSEPTLRDGCLIAKHILQIYFAPAARVIVVRH